MPKTKFIQCKVHLQQLNKVAIDNGYNQVIEPTSFDRIEDARYPITQSIYESDGIVRCRIIINDKGNAVLLDMNVDVFNALPEHEST